MLHALDKEQHITHILFIDPKGEREIIGGTKGNYKSHPKVKLAQKSQTAEDQTLITLEKQLEKEQNQTVRLDSFLLLRDTSDLGRGQSVEWIQENMLAYNILRLDWHQQKEEGATSQCLNDDQSYLDLMFEKAGIQQ